MSNSASMQTSRPTTADESRCGEVWAGSSLLMSFWNGADRKINSWIHGWTQKGYPDGIPDEAPSTLEELGRVPSYRVICEAILRNDHTLSVLGYSRTKCRAYMEFKRIELQARGKRVNPDTQRSMEF